MAPLAQAGLALATSIGALAQFRVGGVGLAARQGHLRDRSAVCAPAARGKGVAHRVPARRTMISSELA